LSLKNRISGGELSVEVVSEEREVHEVEPDGFIEDGMADRSFKEQ